MLKRKINTNYDKTTRPKNNNDIINWYEEGTLLESEESISFETEENALNIEDGNEEEGDGNGNGGINSIEIVNAANSSKTKSFVWEHFNKFIDQNGVKWAKCKYCL